MSIVISTLGEDRPGIVETLSEAILDKDCNIEDSRMSVMGGVFAVILLVSGAESSIQALQQALPGIAEQAGLTLTMHEAGEHGETGNYLPYQVQIVAMDHPGIVNRLSQFFAKRGINIHQLDTSSYSAAHTATPMFAVHMKIDIPVNQHLPELRDAFHGLCDEYNLDGSIEAEGPQ